MTHSRVPDQRTRSDIELLQGRSGRPEPPPTEDPFDAETMSLVSARLTMAATLVDSLTRIPRPQQPFVIHSALDYARQALWMLQDIDRDHPRP